MEIDTTAFERKQPSKKRYPVKRRTKQEENEHSFKRYPKEVIDYLCYHYSLKENTINAIAVNAQKKFGIRVYSHDISRVIEHLGLPLRTQTDGILASIKERTK